MSVSMENGLHLSGLDHGISRSLGAVALVRGSHRD